ADEEGRRRSGDARQAGWILWQRGEWRVDSYRSVGHEPETRVGGMMRRYLLLALMTAGLACSANVRLGSAPSPASDAAAIPAICDTPAAGWNGGELPVYLSAYVDTATTMGSTGLVRGVRGIE